MSQVVVIAAADTTFSAQCELCATTFAGRLDDDLEDAKWDAAFEFKVPATLKSGVYAARLRTDTAALTWEAVGLAAIVTGIVLLGMHPAMPCGADNSAPARDLQPS